MWSSSRRGAAVGLALAMLLAAGPGATAAVATGVGTSVGPGLRAGPIDPELAQRLAAADPTDLLDVAVVLTTRADLRPLGNLRRPQRLRAVERALRTHADRTQKGVRDLLAARTAQHLAADVLPLWVTNEVDVRATPAVVRELAARPDVASVHLTVVLHAADLGAVAAAAGGPTEPNVARVGAPAMWAQGFTGQGVVVASMDTGVDVTHPDLASSWRGGTNSWFDPNGQHPTTPTDVSGHGTATTGVMVGGSAGGSAVGVAPGATWIAVKIFDDRGVATSTAIHRGFQWLLDPDGDPATADAPNVVNDSWTMSTPGCSLEFQADLRSLRAAGILPVFAAGNEGPLPGTVRSPANNPEAVAVGGTDDTDGMYASSSRGPSACAGATDPTFAAPAVAVRTTDLYGQYVTTEGTSLAAPHVAGALALLLDEFPDLSADRQEAALEAGAVDLSLPGVDDDVGFGRLDVAAAADWLATTPDFTVAAAPPTVTVEPGASATVSVQVGALRGFAADVDLTLSGVTAAQATATFAPARVVGGSGPSTLTLTADPSLPPGSYPLTITGTGGGIAHAAAVTLVVPAPPGFTVAASPASITTVAGGSAAYSVAVTPVSGFAGDVTLTLGGLTAPQAWAFSPVVVPGASGTSALTVTTTSTLAPGSYPLTVTATGGSLTRTAALTLVVTAPPDFGLAVTPAQRTVNAGANGTFTATVSALSGFGGAVALSLTGLPATVGTATFTKPVVTGAGTSLLTLATLTTAPAGTYPLTLRGTSGSLVHTAALTLVVPVRDFTLAASPTSVSVTRGQTGTSTLTVTPKGGFTGGVALTATGLPAGATVTYSVNPVVTSGTSTLRIRTTTTTPRGTYSVRVTGTSGSLSHAVSLTLVVR
ncbi:hypothetical protein Cch01nite_20570 [Cellulomonas chitinilytica]|uniref:Peptidase S8/S53 domain-containing protein n=1 Tax=Cellulomonas chitinilytica TaxID=398759 RepID=A0A919P115_9CELL|nr:S8 family serine peptidase [Cellulomonas chitinilytica]GIG21333.1 hypothetical protein Cch01nite_20570 [Cellulomonas chitinilytica]